MSIRKSDPDLYDPLSYLMMVSTVIEKMGILI